MKTFITALSALALCLGCNAENIKVDAKFAPSVVVTPASIPIEKGPLSGYAWPTGNWINGTNELAAFENFRGFKSDVVTQSMGRTINEIWPHVAGAASEAIVDAELAQSPTEFKPTFNGVFKPTAWPRHIWGPEAVEHRKRRIHLAWMDVIPKAAGNNNGKNPAVWKEIRSGAADKYFFLLGRKFAFRDLQDGDPAYNMVFDLVYEWTLVTHSSWPGGGAHVDFPYGWARMAKAFKQGYAYQRGTPCPYLWAWRPQLRFSVKDAAGKPVRHEALFPNNIAGESFAENKINGIVVMPGGPIGKTVDLIGVSWHDSAAEQVRGETVDGANSNWKKILAGTENFWGMQEMADFARREGLKIILPEWAPKQAGKYGASKNPADVIRFTHYFLQINRDIVAYETYFQLGEGRLSGTWKPEQPAGNDPGQIYKSLWKAAQ
jgi:hypothetical protein